MSSIDETGDQRNGGELQLHPKQPLIGIIFNYSLAEKLAEALKRLCPGIRVEIVISGLEELTEEEKVVLQSIDVLITQPNMVKKFDFLYSLPNLKWMHSLTAGIELILTTIKPGQPFPSITLTRNAGYFDLQMAQYVFGMIIAREKHFKEYKDDQFKKQWVSHGSRSLSTLTLGIVGFGKIGKRVADIAKVFGMKVWALVRNLPNKTSNYSNDGIRYVTDLGHLLSSSDYVLSVLPGGEGTDGFFDGDVLLSCQSKRPVFINIGRGNVVNDSTIIRALDEGWISHAILDVFAIEPLPTESPLWVHPQVSITPHLSGICIREEPFLRVFVENYNRYIRGQSFVYSVDWNKGY